MTEKVQLRIDSPCGEDWGGMRAENQGRYCGSCQKVVVDFTAMSDPEIIEWFSQPQGQVCGRLQTGQLDRELAPVFRRKNGRLGWWRYVLAGLLMSSEVSAQTKRDGSPAAQYDSTSRKYALGEIPPFMRHRMAGDGMAGGGLPDTLRGRLMCGEGESVSFATITIDHGHGVSADANGRFAIPRSMLGNQRTLTVSAVGYETQVIEIGKIWTDDREQIVTIKIKVLTTMGLVAVRRVPRKKAPDVFLDSVTLCKDSLVAVGLGKKALTVYPNPVARGTSVMLSLRLDRPGAYNAQLYNMAGVLVESVPFAGDERIKQVQLSIPGSLAAGVYVVKLSRPGEGKVYTQQVVVL
jgi:hypothetical protein